MIFMLNAAGNLASLLYKQGNLTTYEDNVIRPTFETAMPARPHCHFRNTGSE
jgi:hypothetical protein